MSKVSRRRISGAASASATWGPPARLEGQHGAGLNVAVLSRRRAPHRAGQHACRTSILRRMAFVYAAAAMTGRPPLGLAVCSYARGAAARSPCAAESIQSCGVHYDAKVTASSSFAGRKPEWR